ARRSKRHRKRCDTGTNVWLYACQGLIFLRYHFATQSIMQQCYHVAIIMDGNGRWAASRGLPRAAGHRAGAATVRQIVERAPELGVRTLTLYAFSTDNWQRPEEEVVAIFW